jgi:small subunit ribosomal protein S14
MAKKSAINRNKHVEKLIEKYAARRARLKAIILDDTLPMGDRFEARLKLAELPRASSPVRYRNRCEVTGRPRAFYRKLKMSRIALRDHASQGLVPGMVKSSW